MTEESTTGKRDFYHWLGTLAIAAGFVLSIVSFMRLCSEECAEGHNYVLFGLPLDPIGILFFTNLAILHYFSVRHAYLKIASLLIMFAGLGAEAVFIYFQHSVIKHWCPVCLSIAAALLVAVLSYLIPMSIELFHKRSSPMKSIRQLSSCVAVGIFAFVVTFLGMGKIDKLAAAEKSIKDSVAFGDAGNKIEVYVFTDWQCPACRKVEPALERMTPKLMEESRLVFVDYAIHPESLNYTPYNISFMVNNKANYWDLRHALTALSTKTKTPTEEDVKKAIAPYGASYKELNFADTTLGVKYFKQLGEQFKIAGTPTVIIVNRDTKKGKKLAGTAEITEANVLKAIRALNE